MAEEKATWAKVNDQGQLVLPADVVQQLGLVPGATLRIERDTNSVRLHRSIQQLAKVYLEPTNRCNITCRTCMRNTWDEPLGMMSDSTFDRVLQSIRGLDPKPLVHLGGIGEPLFHPRAVEMVADLKTLGCMVELITNGTLLTPQRARLLVGAGLDTLWVSLDGATPESYADVRLGAALPTVLEHLRQFRSMRKGFYHPKPEVGIAFVAMKRNIADLPKIIALGRSLGASRFSVSNVLPYTEELRGETLYEHTLKDIAYFESVWLPSVNLPKMEINEVTQQAFLDALRSGCSITLAGSRMSGANDVCTFIESGATAIGWDGSVSPCPPLLHHHTSYLRNWKRTSLPHIIGNITDRQLIDLWNEPSYVAYRERVQGFAFAPCSFCGGCYMLDTNKEDCIGNGFPACGSCLWAQGVIQCP